MPDGQRIYKCVSAHEMILCRVGYDKYTGIPARGACRSCQLPCQVFCTFSENATSGLSNALQYIAIKWIDNALSIRCRCIQGRINFSFPFIFYLFFFPFRSVATSNREANWNILFIAIISFAFHFNFFYWFSCPFIFHPNCNSIVILFNCFFFLYSNGTNQN